MGVSRRSYNKAEGLTTTLGQEKNLILSSVEGGKHCGGGGMKKEGSQ